MLSKKRAYEIINLITENSRFYTTVSIAFDEQGLTRFANSEIHQNVYSSDTEVTINIIEDKKISVVTTNVLEESELISTLRSAEEKIEHLPQGEIDLPKISDVEAIEIDNYCIELNDAFDISNRAELLKQGIEILDEGFIAAGAFSLTNTSLAWGNTMGLRRFSSSSNVNLNVMIIHESGVSGYINVDATKPEELDVIAEFNKSYNKARMGLKPISIEPGKYDVVLEPLAVGDLIKFTGYVGMNSKFYQDGMGCFTGRLGEKVLGDNVSIVDDGNNQNTAQLPFDFEGYKREKLSLVENGILKEIAYDTITALKEGKKTTGHSIGYKGEGGIPLNLVVSPGNSSLEDMIKSTKKGLLVSRFHYMNIVNPREGVLTALTRDGLFLIEDGEIKAPVHNLRFTDSIARIFNNVEEITSTREKAPGFVGPSYVPGMKIKDFQFTGKTEL